MTIKAPERLKPKKPLSLTTRKAKASLLESRIHQSCFFLLDFQSSYLLLLQLQTIMDHHHLLNRLLLSTTLLSLLYLSSITGKKNINNSETPEALLHQNHFFPSIPHFKFHILLNKYQQFTDPRSTFTSK